MISYHLVILLIESRKKAVSKSKSAVISALRNVYFAAINNLANLTPAQRFESRPAHNLLSKSICTEFQQAIAEVIEVDILDKVKSSGLFSIMIDEYLDEVLGRVVPTKSFLGIRQLSIANADCIVAEVLKVLGDKGLEVRDLAGMSTDGASVMVGSKKGVVTQVKALSPGVLSTHCIAHRLALSCGDAADKIPYLVQFQEVLNSAYKYFHNSPKNQARLESIQSVLQIHSTKFKEVFHTRWLSFEGAVHAIVLNYQALLSVFLEESSGKALSLYKPVATYKFLYCCHFLSDVLKQLSILCKMFQKTDLDFSKVNPMLHSTVSTLERLSDCKSGPILKGFLDSIPTEPVVDDSGLTTFEFGGHTIRDSVRQRQEATSACQQFVLRVIGNIQDRFCDEGMLRS
ncbi:hypothetical protein KUTeg_000228 [Tegillarca granosa]|uniref:DUF4371 domain-containing protein n=1 Tax=Tegillarca granosa TaxID=220873 RepID=A0ABQ9FWX7_TEGGR|nr:hypothetical protein KUTeg_000228 [Tegillarca granosa]